MSSIRKIKHRPEIRIRVWLGDLIQRRIIRIDNLVNG